MRIFFLYSSLSVISRHHKLSASCHDLQTYLINNEEYIWQIPADILLPMWLSHIFCVTRSGDAYPVHVSALPRVPGAKHEASGNNNNNNTLGVFIFNI